tara:strand:- start:9151 stop:10194 length:1044 start_codon:yes stop_codon:yes gene_type:complete
MTNKVNFMVGSEKRFADFIKDLGKEKVAWISHTDQDGIGAVRVGNEVVKADIVKFLSYGDLNDRLVEELREAKVKKIIFSDLFIKKKEFVSKLEKFADLLIIDHHIFRDDLNSEKTVFMNAQGHCATYLVYYLFSQIQDLEKLDWVVCCACVSDFLYLENKEWMSSVYKKYGDEFELEGRYARRNGKIWDLQYKISLGIIYYSEDLKKVYDSLGSNFSDIGELADKGEEVQRELDLFLEKFELGKKEFSTGYFWEVDPKPKHKIKALLANIIAERYQDKSIILAGENSDGYFTFSARRNDLKEDMNLLLKGLTDDIEGGSGGGHVPAAGGMVPLDKKEEFIRKLMSL